MRRIDWMKKYGENYIAERTLAVLDDLYATKLWEGYKCAFREYEFGASVESKNNALWEAGFNSFCDGTSYWDCSNPFTIYEIPYFISDTDKRDVVFSLDTLHCDFIDNGRAYMARLHLVEGYFVFKDRWFVLLKKESARFFFSDWRDEK